MLTFHIPCQVALDAVRVVRVEVPFTLGIIGPRVSITHSAVPMLNNALRYARDTVSYLTGERDAAPVPFPPGVLQRFEQAE